MIKVQRKLRRPRTIVLPPRDYLPTKAGQEELIAVDVLDHTGEAKFDNAVHLRMQPANIRHRKRSS